MNTYVAKIPITEGADPACVVVKAQSRRHAATRCNIAFSKRGLPRVAMKEQFQQLDDAVICINDLASPTQEKGGAE